MNLVINVNKKTIGVVAPSFGATITPYKERLEVAIKNFKELGYNVIRVFDTCKLIKKYF